MNVADLAALIDAGLAAAGITDVPVVPPGTTVAAMPCVALAPAANRIEDGNRTFTEGVDVVCLVPRNNQPDQYTRLSAIEAAVIQALLPSTVRFEGDSEFAVTGGDGEPPAMSRTIPTRFVSDVNLC